ncbi:hypothetical protein TNCV_4705521 [Trichonephila clavipes]|nr:hypothetical protein TNCV_4705521 [Trichonephila clavipes]
MQFGTLSCWMILSIHSCCSVNRTAMKFSNKTTVPLTSPGLASSRLDKQSSDFYVINWPPRSPGLNPIEPLWDVLNKA